MSGDVDADDELIAELLLAWQASFDRKEPEVLERLCATRPDLLPRLLTQIESLEQIDHLIEKLSFQDDVRLTHLDATPGGQLPEIPGYKILVELGRGGMGIVYKAVQERLNRVVAIKIVRGGRWVSPREIERFRSEAEVLAKIQHSGVVQIYDILEHDGLLCLILEFVNGCSLSESMRSQPLTPMESAAIMHEVASVMSAVHAKGVLHRDIKPANILMQSDGRIKITDFGIAKALSTSSKQTMSGEVLGTPSYMAPELVLEKRELITVQTDVYAIGATFYELLTRRAPFGGTSVAETFQQVTNDSPLPPQLFAAKIPQDLATICMKCLEKDPNRRYLTAELLQDDLDRFLHGRPILARPVSAIERCQRWCRRNPEKAFYRLFVLLAVITIVTGASWFRTRLNLTQKEMSEKQAALDSEQFHARLNRLRAQSFVRPPGWIDANWADIPSIAKLAKTPQNRQELRNEAIHLLTQHDVQHQKTLLTGVDICRVAHHPTQPILALAENVSVDDRNVVIRLIDTSTHELIQTVSFPVRDDEHTPDDAEGCRSLLFSPSGADLFVGTRRGHIHQFNTADWSCRQSWIAHFDRVMGLTFDDTTGTLYSCARSGEVKKWTPQGDSQPPEGDFVTKIDGEAFGLDYLNQGLIISAGSVILHDLKSRHEASMIDGPRPAGATCIRCPGASTALVGRGPRIFQVKTELNHESSYVVRELIDPKLPTPHPHTIESIAMSHDGRFAVSCGGNILKVWDFASGRPFRSISLGDGSGKAVQFLPDGVSFVVAGEGQVDLYEISTNPAWKACSIADTRVTSATISGDGQMLVHAADNSNQKYSTLLQRRHLRSGERKNVVIFPSRSVDEVLLGDGKIRCLNESEPENYLLQEFQADELTLNQGTWIGNDVEHLTLNPSRQFVFFCSDDLVSLPSDRRASAVYCSSISTVAPVMRWSNVESAQRLRKSQILALAVGSNRFATASRDGFLRIHAFNDGKVEVSRPTEIDITTATILADRFLLCGDESGAIQLRRLENGEVLDQKFEHHSQITSLNTANDGKTVITGCGDGHLQFWQFDTVQGKLTPSDRVGPLSGSIKRISSSDDGKTIAIVVGNEHATRILDMNELEEQLKQVGLAALCK